MGSDYVVTCIKQSNEPLINIRKKIIFMDMENLSVILLNIYLLLYILLYAKMLTLAVKNIFV